MTVMPRHDYFTISSPGAPPQPVICGTMQVHQTDDGGDGDRDDDCDGDDSERDPPLCGDGGQRRPWLCTT